MAQKLAKVSGVHTIEITHCKLQEEPPLHELHSVVVLRLSKNELTCLSRGERPAQNEQHQKPYRLEIFACDRNRLQMVEPGALSGPFVASLQVLDLSRNQLSFLPDGFLHGAKALRYVDLSFNRLFSLPDSILECKQLLILHVDNNELEKLPSDIGVLKGLRKLSASYNKISELPPTIGSCKLLEKIRVVSNQITVMPYSLLKLWKRKGGVLEELLVEGNPLLQPSITAFQMGGLDRALRLFSEWVKAQLELERQMESLNKEKDNKDTRHDDAPRISETLENGELRGSVVSNIRLSSFSFDDGEHQDSGAGANQDEAADLGEPDYESLNLELVQLVDESGKRVSKFALSAQDWRRFESYASKYQQGGKSGPGGDAYYFSHVANDHHAVLAIRDAETALLLLKRRFWVLKQKEIALQSRNKEVTSASELTLEFCELLKCGFDPLRYNGQVPIQDIDLYFCTLVYGSKPTFTSIHALWDKFEVGEKGYMTKDEWFNLCARVKTKLPQKIQQEIWDLLSWRNRAQMSKKDFVAGWHIHDLEVQDLHAKSLTQVLKFQYYSMGVGELQERMRIRLAEDADVLNFPKAGHNDILSIPFGVGERRLKR
ncbi:lrrc57 [Symbiodinium natans]|uniref:Lrrc57 protein n=1 Tax=Symbiodinium natans TaxID=878477 RepID=A0A812PRY6_9DINO|nr:lrrc57 [Symbiodinium natans]